MWSFDTSVRFPPGCLFFEIFQVCRQTGGGPRVDPEHTGGIIDLMWIGNFSNLQEEMEDVSLGLLPSSPITRQKMDH